MHTGAITSYIDVAQVTLYLFWFFFAGLIIWLRREDKREGYPLISDRSPHIRVEGWPAPPPPKVFKLAHGGTYEAPNNRPEFGEIRANPMAPYPGAPLEPTGDPLLDGVGPASFANRSDEPDHTIDGAPKIVPMRVAAEFSVLDGNPDPRGMPVIGTDRVLGGIVRDIWVDRSEPQIRYLEVEVTASGNRRHVLLPIYLAKVHGSQKEVRVKSICGHQFAGVPGLRNPDQVTLLEEDKICAYYAGGHLYATPKRLGPVI
jgi:photosynthetic reaction center H subunit